MYKAIVNGMIVTEDEMFKGSVIYDDQGIITALVKAHEGSLSQYEALSEVIDADGCFVVPGGVDGHVHFGGFGTIPIADDFYSGSMAALAGGTTSIVDFCQPQPGQLPPDCIRQRKSDAQAALVDYAFHFVFTENYREELKYLDQMLGEGIGAFKIFTYYEHTTLTPGDMRNVMEALRNRGPLLIHCEEPTIIDCMKEKLGRDSKDMTLLAKSRPNICEAIAVNTAAELSKETGAKICIAHTSTKEAAAIKKREKASDNNLLFIETCPQYLAYTEDKMQGADGVLYTINPPLRSEKDRLKLWEAVMDGTVDMLSTDHCPYLKKYKYGETYTAVPCGVDGVQTRMRYLFSEGVIKRGMRPETFVRLTSSNAARFYGLYPKKGCISAGSDADLVILNPYRGSAYTADEIAGRTDYTIYEGFEWKGKIEQVIKGGNCVYKDGTLKPDIHSGKFLNNVKI